MTVVVRFLMIFVVVVVVVVILALIYYSVFSAMWVALGFSPG